MKKLLLFVLLCAISFPPLAAADPATQAYSDANGTAKAAQEFINQVHTGVVRVNGPTHGSEAHMPFGGPGMSGNGWREPGTAALDFYSEWKQISIDHDPGKV